MKPLLYALGRLAIVSVSAFGIATAVNLRNHQGYWHGTIFRVQTVDFNMLSHMAPTKLSQVLWSGDREELQRTLDSNYGLFGMVVTDCTSTTAECPNQIILQSTNSNFTWKQQLTVESLAGQPYDLLRYPPPNVTESGFDNSRDTTWDSTGRTNRGRVIGRVYYVRGIPPSFWASYWRWIQGFPGSLLSDSGASKYYALTLFLFIFVGFTAWSILEWILHCKHIQHRQAQQEKVLLLKEMERLKQQLRDRLNQVANLISEKEQSSFELASYQQKQGNRVRDLERLIAQLERQLTIQVQERDSSEILTEFDSALRVEIQQREQTIARLKSRIDSYAKNDVSNIQSLESLGLQLQRMMKQQSTSEQVLQQRENALDDLQKKLDRQAQEDREKTHLLETLKRQLQDTQRQVSEDYRRQKELETSISELNQQREHDNVKLRALEEQIASIDENSNELILNDFEHSVLTVLKNSPKSKTNQWRVLEQFDVSLRSNLSQFIDCMVIGRSCIFVIEAKFYSGRIYSKASSKSTPWLCEFASGNSIQVKSSGGKNPYEQIFGYINHVRRRVRQTGAGGKVAVYGIVVFPEGADVTQISAEIDGGYYGVTTLDSLIQVMQDIETAFLSRYSGRLSSLSLQQLEDLMYGKPLRRVA